MKVWSILLWAIIALAVCRPAEAGTEPPVIEIKNVNPQEPVFWGQEVKGPYTTLKELRIFVYNIPSRATLRIRYAGETHTHVYDASQVGTNPPWDDWLSDGIQFVDEYFLPEPGKHPIFAELIVGDPPQSVATAKGTVWFKKIPAARLQENHVELCVRLFSGTGFRFLHSRASYFSALSETLCARREGRPPDKESVAHTYQAAHHKAMMSRISALERYLGEGYAGAFRFGDQLQTLNLAHEIWIAEGSQVVRGPLLKEMPVMYDPEARDHATRAPSHFEGLALFYARRGEREKAITWWNEVADFYLEQHRRATHMSPKGHKRCLERAAEAYREVAKMHMVVFQDMEGYRIWRQKASKVRPE